MQSAYTAYPAEFSTVIHYYHWLRVKERTHGMTYVDIYKQIHLGTKYMPGNTTRRMIY